MVSIFDSVNNVRVRFSEPFPKRQILDFSKLKDFADSNFKFNENGGKISKTVENTVGKGENARYCRHIKTRACLRKS